VFENYYYLDYDWEINLVVVVVVVAVVVEREEQQQRHAVVVVGMHLDTKNKKYSQCNIRIQIIRRQDEGEISILSLKKFPR